ncbi:MAG TPA: M23 family metallopeptidase [Pilimelia sp.]|nr:M23 family metallopeptidase [Pilimelia sp.]
MTIGDIQFRISQIQSMMHAAVAPAPAAPTTAAGGAASAGGPPGASATAFAAALDQALAAEKPRGAANGGWQLPVQGTTSSEFGPRWGRQHEGIDIAAATGTPVRAAADGVVRKASWYGGYGNAVIIDHGGGVSTLYAHNSSLTVKPGERVRAGQLVAKVGSTGDSTGPHLHFEVEVDGKKVDPRPWFARRGLNF